MREENHQVPAVSPSLLRKLLGSRGVVLLWEVEKTLAMLPTHPHCPRIPAAHTSLLPTHPHCPQGAVPKISEDRQNLIDPSSQQGVALIQTPVHSPLSNLAYSQWANSGGFLQESNH